MKKTILQKILNKIKELLGLMDKEVEEIIKEKKEMSNIEKVYQTAQKSIGQDLCNVSPELGCIVVINEIFKRAIGQYIDGDNSTYRLYHFLLSDKRFKQVDKPQQGTLMLAVTGMGNGSLDHGHGAIKGKNNQVISNNSKTGLVDDHYNSWSWETKYEKGGGFRTFYFDILG